MTTLRRLIRRLLGRHDERTNIHTGNTHVTVTITCTVCGPIHTEHIHRANYTWARIGMALNTAETHHHGRKKR